MTEITAGAVQAPARGKLRVGVLLKHAGIAIGAAVVANEVVRLLASAIFDFSPEFKPLGFGAPAIFTTINLVLGTVVAFVVARFAHNPARTYWIVATVALVLSYYPNVNLAVTGESPFPGASAAAQWTLAVMHLVAFFIAVPILVRGIVASRTATET